MTAGAPGPHGWRTVYLVVRREMRVRVRSRVFVGPTVLMVALVVIGIVGYSLIGGQTKPLRVGFSGASQALEQDFSASATALGQPVAVSSVSDEAAGRGQVSAGTLDVLVAGSATSPTVVVQASATAVVQAALERAVLSARFTALGIPPGVLATVTAGLQVPVDALQPAKPGVTQDKVVGLAVGILLWIALGLYGSQVAQGVVEEKATRIMEIVLATIRPSQLLAGKIAGIGLVGLLQLAIVAAAALAAVSMTNVVTTPALAVTAVLGYLLWFLLGFLLYATGYATLAAVAATNVVTTPALGAAAVLGYLLWFLLGFMFYATAYATLAALVSRPEEVQGAVAPINVFQILAYLLAYIYLANPSSPLALVASVLPPFAPILMAVRISAGDVPAWQLGLALVLIVAAIGGLIWLAGRVYANSAMRIGSRVRFMDAFRG